MSRRELSEISVLVVDDHTAIADALADALRASGIGRVDVAPSFDVEALVSTSDPGCVILLDHHLGGDARAAGLIAPLVEAGAVVLVFTGLASVIERVQAIKAGAAGVLDKAMPFQSLVESIGRAASGLDPMTPNERAALLAAGDAARQELETTLAPFRRLSGKESVVLAHLVDGRAPVEIAALEHVSLATVRTHVRAVFVKLGVHTEREAVSLARTAGWHRNHHS